MLRYDKRRLKIVYINSHFGLHTNHNWTNNNSDPNSKKRRCETNENTLIFPSLSLGTVLDHVVAEIFIIMVIFTFSHADRTNYLEPRMTFMNKNLDVDIQQTASTVLRFLNRTLWYIYVIRTKIMHTFKLTFYYNLL